MGYPYHPSSQHLRRVLQPEVLAERPLVVVAAHELDEELRIVLELEVQPVVVGGEAHAEVKQRAHACLQLPLRRMFEVARDDCGERLAIHDPAGAAAAGYSEYSHWATSARR